jgi:hypothetical protein
MADHSSNSATCGPLRRGIVAASPLASLGTSVQGGLTGFEDRLWGSEPSPHGAVQGPASFEAVLKQLEDQGFRHVPRGSWAHGGIGSLEPEAC